jgi:lipopolysaccharide export system protein LptC
MDADRTGPESIAARTAAEIAGPPGQRKFPDARKASARHSLFVNFMRFVLPAIALSLVAVVVVWPQMHDSGKMRFRLNFAKINPNSASTLSMVKPRFTGLDSGQRPYTVTADSATQVASGSSLIDLDKPVADLTMKDGTWVALRSTEGTYDQATHDLDLRGEVNLYQDKGYEFTTKRAYMNLQAGTAHGEEPVEGQGPFGHLTSKGFRISEHGKYLVFTGPAKLVLYPKSASKPAKGGK